VKATVDVDGQRFFKGRLSLVLAANVGTILGGVEVFTAARPDDGLLELGVVTASNPVGWATVLGRVALHSAEHSPFVDTTRGRSFRIRFDRKVQYEVDGGARPAARDLRIKVHPRSVTICVPA
jgi:diacylglycerol kinase family enzyme